MALFAALAAIAAAGFAGWQGWLIRETAQSQQRAYVFVRGGGVMLSENETFAQAFIDLQNFGQTPGYDFETWTEIALREVDDAPYGATTDKPRQRSIVGPGADLKAPSGKVRLEPGYLAAIINRQAAIFVWGGASYRDAFQRCWEFIFRMRVAGPIEALRDRDTQQIAGTGWGLSPDPRYGYSEREKKCTDQTGSL